jgi:hypothetical protein
MASVNAFNDMMGQFLAELHKTFPEEKGIKKCMSGFELMRQTNPRLVVDGFMAGVTPFADKISAKDDTFFINEFKNLDFLKDINLEGHWSSISDGTKDAIWQYVQTLYMLGTTISSIPEDTLSMIEKVAKQCADQMESDGSGIDEAALMKTMQGMLGGMLKK